MDRGVLSERVQAYLALLAAIALELCGTTLLARSEQFTRWAPTLGMAVCYLAAFYFLSLSLRELPVGVAYAIWSGVGIVAIALIGWLWFKQPLDLAACCGMGLIVAGVLVMNLLSRSVSH